MGHVGWGVFHTYRPSTKEFIVNLAPEHRFLWWGKILNYRERTNGKTGKNLMCSINVTKNITRSSSKWHRLWSLTLHFGWVWIELRNWATSRQDSLLPSSNLINYSNLSNYNNIQKKTLCRLWKGYFYLCPCMDFLQTLHITNSLYTNYENVFIELDS